MRAGQQSQDAPQPTTVAEHGAPRGRRPCPARFPHLTGGRESREGPRGRRHAASRGRWTTGVGGRVGWGAWRHCKLRITSSAVCEGRSAAVPRLGGTPWGPLTGGVTEPGAGRPCAGRAAHRRSIRKVSSVAGSARTMSGSLSMCSPSRVRGSILSSSKGNWLSESKLTSPTPASVLVSSLERLGGDSPVTGGGGYTQKAQLGPGSPHPDSAPPRPPSMLRPYQGAHLSGLSPKGHLRCLGTFLVVTTGGNATGIRWVEARDAAQHPTAHGTISTQMSGYQGRKALG